MVEEKPTEMYDLANWLWTPFLFPTDESELAPNDEPIVVLMDDDDGTSKKNTKNNNNLKNSTKPLRREYSRPQTAKSKSRVEKKCLGLWSERAKVNELGKVD